MLPSASAHLPLQRFAQVVADAPLVSLDWVVLRGEGDAREVLLGYRNNRPAQGCWFVPGGRILKGETLQVASARVVQAELGAELSALLSGGATLNWQGVFQHFYADSFVAPDVPTHYVVLAHVLHVPASCGWQGPVGCGEDGQHARWRWWPVADALASPDVHVHTQDYLMPGRAVLGAA